MSEDKACRADFEAWARPKWRHREDFDPVIGAKHRYNNYEVQAAWEAWQAACDHRSAPVVPEGWRPVPVKPTQEMLDAGSNSRCFREDDGDASLLETNTESTWDAMINAAPTPPETK